MGDVLTQTPWGPAWQTPAWMTVQGLDENSESPMGNAGRETLPLTSGKRRLIPLSIGSLLFIPEGLTQALTTGIRRSSKPGYGAHIQGRSNRRREYGKGKGRNPSTLPREQYPWVTDW